jgi:hypothetical protein
LFGRTIVRHPGSVANGGSLPSSTTIISPSCGVADGWALNAGTTIVTSAVVKDDSAGAG